MFHNQILLTSVHTTLGSDVCFCAGLKNMQELDYENQNELVLTSFCSVNPSASCAESHLDVLFDLSYRALEYRGL